MYELKILKERLSELEILFRSCDGREGAITSLLKEVKTECNRALDFMTATETDFRHFFEIAPGPLCIIDISNRQVINCNPYMSEWLGYNRAELLAMKLDDLIIREAGDASIDSATDCGLTRVQERRYLKKDGSTVDAEVIGTLIQYDGRQCLAVLSWDVTARKRVEDAARYQELFDNVTDPVFITDLHGSFLDVNEGTCRVFEYAREQLLQMYVKQLVKPNQTRILAENAKQLQRGASVRFEMELNTKKGESIAFELQARPIAYKGKPAVLSVARDLSLSRKLEQALVRTEHLTTIGEMASGIAHNFNNLLQMVMGAGLTALSKLKSGKISQCSEAIGAILNSCERGADIVRRIKDFTDVRSQRVNQVHNFDLAELVREAVELTKPLWKDLPTFQQYRIDLVGPKRCYLNGKPSEIYEVLVNLIKNALEAMSGGGVITISIRRAKGRVRLEVADTGHGIPEENLQRIFEPFFTTKGSKSSGLGLSSSHSIIKQHQGEIHVASTVGKGTVFTVVLPAAEALKKKRAVSTRPVPSPAPKTRFLIIDDEVNILKAITMFFEDSEIEIVTAQSGREGLKIFQDGGIDVVLCDLGMDDMNGWDVGKSMKDYCETKSVPKPPFLMYTGWDIKVDPKELARRGVDRVVTKPVPYDQLLRIVREETSKRKKPRKRPLHS